MLKRSIKKKENMKTKSKKIFDGNNNNLMHKQILAASIIKIQVKSSSFSMVAILVQLSPNEEIQISTNVHVIQSIVNLCTCNTINSQFMYM